MMVDEDPVAARSRIEKEMAKVQEQIKQKRQEHMKALVGETASPIRQRKENVKLSYEQFAMKGKEHLLNEDGSYPSPIVSPTSSATSSPRKAYQALADQNAMKSAVGQPSLFEYDPVQDRNEQVAATKQAGQQQTPTKETVTALTPKDWDRKTYYTLIDLRQRRVPKTIDWKNREQYLSPSDFYDAFKMTKEEFASQPKWKRDKLKQQLYLF